VHPINSGKFVYNFRLASSSLRKNSGETPLPLYFGCTQLPATTRRVTFHPMASLHRIIRHGWGLVRRRAVAAGVLHVPEPSQRLMGVPMQIDLSGKLALVTGAAGDLGRVITRTLARCGADVAIHYHTSHAPAAALLAEIQALGRRGMIVQADVGDAASVEQMRAAITATLGDPDIVVANAVAQIHPWQSVLEESLADYESQFRTCVLQNVLLAKAFVPAMIRQRWGRVIALNTECAMQCTPNQSAYVAGKRGMDGVLRVLAREVGAHQITVNQVAPGWMISQRDREAGTQRQEHYEKHIPLGHRGTDQDVANAVAFLASDLAAFITGVYLPVCGGNVMPAI